MKYLNKFIYICSLFLVLSSCNEDDRLMPEDFVEDRGVYARILESPTLTFDVINIDNPENVYSVNLEIVETDPSVNAESIEFFVSFDDRTPGIGGDVDYDPQSLGVFDDFQTDGDLKTIDASFTLEQSIDLLGIEEDSINGGDLFIYSWAITDNQQREFTSKNFFNDVGSGAFNSPFKQNVSMVCPVPSDYAVGEYDLEFVSGGGFEPWESKTVTVSRVEGNPTKRQFDFTYLPTVFPTDATFEFELNCERVIVSQTSVAVGCGGSPNITWAQGEVPSSTYDTSDDSVIEITFADAFFDGGCGISPTTTKLRLVKQ